jgi:8-oxo-dGTP diphosphatase
MDTKHPAPGRFRAGIAALIWSPEREKYLLIRRSADKDFAPGVWECVTGRVDQGERFEEALHREVREELGVEVQIEFVVGTSHFYRGEPVPENELLGVVYFCSLVKPGTIRTSPEHSEHRWVSLEEAEKMLTAANASTEWLRTTLSRAEAIRRLSPKALRAYWRRAGFALD